MVEIVRDIHGTFFYKSYGCKKKKYFEFLNVLNFFCGIFSLI